MCKNNPATQLIHQVTLVSLYVVKRVFFFFSKRLGFDARALCPDFDAKYTDAQILLSEIQLTTNHYIADSLLRAYDKATPLLRQRPPATHLLKNWCDSFAEVAWNSIGLARYFKNQGKMFD